MLLVPALMFQLNMFALAWNRMPESRTAKMRCILTWFASFSFSLFIAANLLGMLNLYWFTAKTESIAYTLFDVVTKFLYASFLAEAHVESISPEDALRVELASKERELALKESANAAQRHFLRYVFHEVPSSH